MNFRELAEIIAGLIGQDVTPFGKGLIVHALIPEAEAHNVRVTVAGYGYTSVVGVNQTQTKFYLTPIDKSLS